MKMKPDLSVSIGSLKMKNPVMTASGTFGYGAEYADLIDIERLGAVVVKGIMVEPWEGNETPRMHEVKGGLLNAIGLQGPGVEGFTSKYLPFFEDVKVPLVVNIWGRTVHEYADVAAKLSDYPRISALELNISCPNVKKGGLAFGTDPESARTVIESVRSVYKGTLITKLAPNVPDISVFAKIAEDAGCDAVALINTIPAMAIDVRTRKPILANLVGGLSGPAIHPVAVKLVWEAAKAVKIPVIGMGGITNSEEALEFLIAGASAVAVGTANFTDPSTALRVIQGIEQYMTENGMRDMNELVGSVVTGKE
jgi:dihydroorotate dehydrogenase (NAD+) catalytic subunit